MASTVSAKDAKDTKKVDRTPASYCRDVETTPEMVACAAARYERADKKLNATWAQVKEYLTTGDSGSTDEAKERFKRAQEAQRTWLPYRDATCRAEVESIGGSLERVEVPSCLARLTNERNRYLKQFTAQSEQ